jgi:hypothetical protein
MEVRKNLSNDSDPDPWGAVGLVVMTVSMFAQLAGLKMMAQQLAAQQHVRSGLSNPATLTAFDQLRDAIQAAIQHVGELIRLLQRAHGDDVDPLRAEFRFGSSRAYFDTSTFSRYQELVSQIGLDAAHVSRWTLHMIAIDASFAVMLGNYINTEVTNVHDRINGIFSTPHTNEGVLDECILMLRTFSTILDRFESSRN